MDEFWLASKLIFSGLLLKKLKTPFLNVKKQANRGQTTFILCEKAMERADSDPTWIGKYSKSRQTAYRSLFQSANNWGQSKINMRRSSHKKMLL